MKSKRKPLLVSIIIAAIHCIIGNMMGIYSSGVNILDYIFLPYTFISGTSSLVGWDNLSVIFEIISFIIMIPVFYILTASGKSILRTIRNGLIKHRG